MLWENYFRNFHQPYSAKKIKKSPIRLGIHFFQLKTSKKRKGITMEEITRCQKIEKKHALVLFSSLRKSLCSSRDSNPRTTASYSHTLARKRKEVKLSKIYYRICRFAGLEKDYKTPTTKLPQKVAGK